MALNVQERALAGLLAVVIVVGSALLWVALPPAIFWVAGQVTDDAVRFVLISLMALPVAMVTAAWALYRVNGRYEELRGDAPAASPPSWRESLGEERRGRGGGRKPPRLIDVAMTASAVTALVLFLVWYFSSPRLQLAPLG